MLDYRRAASESFMGDPKMHHFLLSFMSLSLSHPHIFCVRSYKSKTNKVEVYSDHLASLVWGNLPCADVELSRMK